LTNILIVEDDELSFELASELLKPAGHNVIWARNSEECFESTNKDIPDLILMDIGLPEVDGLSITRILKSEFATKNIPVVAFTARVMLTDKENALNAGCEGFIPKPLEVSTFVHTVESFIPNKPKIHNILAIDDNVLNGEIIKAAMESVNQNVTLAYNGKQAMEILEKEKFDLILLDIMMPDMSGFDIIKHIKANPKTASLPVIFVSALDSTDNIVKGFNLGSYEYIVKPFKIAELKARVLNILKIKDLQDELISEKKIFDIISEFSADGIVLLNSKFELISCNHIFLKWIGKKKNQVLNKEFCKIIDCTSEKCIKKCGDINIHFHHELQMDTRRYLGINCSKVLSPQKEIEGYVLVLRDITADKEIEAQKETFVATLTHDLKTPVRAQLQALRMLLDGKFGRLNESQAEILTETLNSNKYMSSMLDNLLTTYKYENGSVVLNKINFDVNNLIKSTFNELKYIAEDKKQSIEYNFNEASLDIFADPIEIKRVVQNLLYNSITYTCEGGKFLVSTAKHNNEAEITFIDNGKGISKTEIESLFNKFTSHAKKFRQVGTGLGLYLSKYIVEKHGGRISVRSEEGKGSKFSVILPVE